MSTSWFLVLVLVGIAQPVGAQHGQWQAYPSLRVVNAIASGGESIWVASEGGVFQYRPGSGEVTRYTTVEGLFSVGAEAIAVDTLREAIWVGYGEGVIDRIDVATGSVTSLFDIARATQFPDRRINRIRVVGDSLFVATAFGVVVFDANGQEVRDTYSRLGPLDPATEVGDVLVAPLPDGRPGLWVGTTDGVVYASRDSPNLQQPSAWTLDPQSPDDVQVLALFRDEVVAGSSDARARGADGVWDRMFFTSSQVKDLVVQDNRIVGLAGFRIHTLEVNLGSAAYIMDDYQDFSGVTLTPEGSLWFGDGRNGIFRADLPSQTGANTATPSQTLVPSGPLTNATVDLAMAPDGTLWAAHDSPFGVAAASRLDESGWAGFSGQDESLDFPVRALLSATIGPDGAFYAGSAGDGLLEITPDGRVTTYRSDNSTLGSTTGSTDFIVVGDAAVDAEGALWVTNRGAPNPLSVRTPDGTWTAVPYPPGVPTSVLVDQIKLDSFGQKWMSGLQSTSSGGRGLVAISTGSTPANPSDDQGLTISGSPSVGLGLPDEKVTALAFDQDDRLWIGTERGLATIFSPGSAFGGDPSLVLPQWARTADGASFLLRDLAISDIAIDPAGQIWLASEAGAWLLDPNGSTVLENYTTENSPLFSNSVISVAVDPNTGRVFFATDKGILSVDGEATAAVEDVQELEVAPSPFRPGTHDRGVLISGLVARTTVQILTLDGQVVATLEGRGGAIRWDGRDARTGTLVGSGVYLVAALAEDGQETAYGKIAVLR